MILIEREEKSLSNHKKSLNFLEYNDDIFVNRSSTMKEAFNKIKKQRTQFNTKQSSDQMTEVHNAKVKYTSLKELENAFPEYCI